MLHDHSQKDRKFNRATRSIRNRSLSVNANFLLESTRDQCRSIGSANLACRQHFDAPEKTVSGSARRSWQCSQVRAARRAQNSLDPNAYWRADHAREIDSLQRPGSSPRKRQIELRMGHLVQVPIYHLCAKFSAALAVSAPPTVSPFAILPSLPAAPTPLHKPCLPSSIASYPEKVKAHIFQVMSHFIVYIEFVSP